MTEFEVLKFLIRDEYLRRLRINFLIYFQRGARQVGGGSAASTSQLPPATSLAAPGPWTSLSSTGKLILSYLIFKLNFLFVMGKRETDFTLVRMAITFASCKWVWTLDTIIFIVWSILKENYCLASLALIRIDPGLTVFQDILIRSNKFFNIWKLKSSELNISIPSLVSHSIWTVLPAPRYPKEYKSSTFSLLHFFSSVVCWGILRSNL